MRNNRGFTLVELLVYMGIFSILLLVLMQLFSAILSTHAESQATSGLSQDANYIFSRLSYDIRQVSSVSVVSSTQLQAGSTTIALSGTTLSETVSGTANALNSTNTKVSNLTFTKLVNTAPGSKPSVQIIMTLQSTTLRPDNPTPQSETFETTIGTR